MYGKELIVKGMRHLIGDGSFTNMWTDQWLPVHPPRPPRPITEVDEAEKVSMYLHSNNTGWDLDKLRLVVEPEDFEVIVSLKISPVAQQDLVGWHYTQDGIYTVKSGYWVAMHLPENTVIQPTNGNQLLKQKMWRTKIPSKIQHFLWKLLSRSLATGNNLRRRHITRDVICKRCFQTEETESHLFFDCDYAKQIWRASGIANTTIDNSNATLEERIQACLFVSSSVRLQHYNDLPIWILWRLWKSRNRLIFQHKHTAWNFILGYARNDANEWRNIGAHAMADRSRSYQRREVEALKRWALPPSGYMKCNVDGSYISSERESTAGWVIRDDFGTYNGAVQAVGAKVGNALDAELQAILMALQHCWMKGYRKIILESDCLKAIQFLRDKNLYFSGYNWIRDITWWSRKFEDVRFSWISREANKVADKLAKTSSQTISFIFHNYVPVTITNLLHEDYVNVHL